MEEITITTLVLDGTLRKRTRLTRNQRRVFVNGTEVWMQSREFTLLLRLAHACRYVTDGWRTPSELEPGEDDNRGIRIRFYVWRLRHRYGFPVAAKGDGSYRLRINPAAVVFNHSLLKDYPDEMIRTMFR